MSIKTNKPKVLCLNKQALLRRGLQYLAYRKGHLQFEAIAGLVDLEAAYLFDPPQTILQRIRMNKKPARNTREGIIAVKYVAKGLHQVGRPPSIIFLQGAKNLLREAL